MRKGIKMNETISFTLKEFGTWFLAFCAGISVVAGAIVWVIKGIKAARAPGQKLASRVKALEDQNAEYRKFFANDKDRIDVMEEGNRIMQRAMLALLSHGIDGNDVDSLKTAKNELQKYLIER